MSNILEDEIDSAFKWHNSNELIYQLTEEVADLFADWNVSIIDDDFYMIEPFDVMTRKELFTYFIENIYKKDKP